MGLGCVCMCVCVLGQAGDLGCEDVCFSGDFPTAGLHFKKGNKSNISHPRVSGTSCKQLRIHSSELSARA